MTTEKPKVFVSYSRRDSSDFAEELVALLELAGFAPFLDRHDIAAGEDWEKRLGGLIQEADTVVFVVSSEAIKSERCVWEVDKTVELSKRLLPVIFKPVSDAEIPQRFRQLQFVRFDTGPGVARPLTQLAEALRQDIDWIREHTRIGEIAARWQARGRPESLLLRGDDLDTALDWAAKRQPAAPGITDLQQAFLNTSAESETARLSKERLLTELQRAQAATARSQRRAKWLLWGVALLILGLFGNVLWHDRDVDRREQVVFTSLATQAMKDEQFDRAMRFALQAYPARGSMPWAPFSTELEGKLAGGRY
jgi:hypothetical protein